MKLYHIKRDHHQRPSYMYAQNVHDRPKRTLSGRTINMA